MGPSNKQRSTQSRVRRRRLRVLRALSAVNALCLLVAYMAITFGPEGHWVSAALGNLPQLIGWPVLALMVWSMLWRDWRSLCGNLVVGVAFAVFLMGFNIPLHRHSAKTADLRIMTYNCHQGQFGAGKLSQTITAQDPDVLCLQEVSPVGKWGDPVFQLRVLLPGKWNVVRDGSTAIFTRLPVVGSRIDYLPSDTGRNVVQADVLVRGRRVTVLSTHFNIGSIRRLFRRGPRAVADGMANTSAVQSSQMNRLLEIAGKCRNPVVITGDFNMVPRGRTYRRIAKRYQDSFHSAGWGFGYTYRSSLPAIRIDYIYAGQEFGVIRCDAPSSEASDHRPVVADLALR